MKDVKFVKGDQVKVTQERFKEALEELGWSVEKPKEVKPAKKAKKEDDNS